MTSVCVQPQAGGDLGPGLGEFIVWGLMEHGGDGLNVDMSDRNT